MELPILFAGTASANTCSVGCRSNWIVRTGGMPVYGERAREGPRLRRLNGRRVGLTADQIRRLE